jgi:hypothetical protein
MFCNGVGCSSLLLILIVNELYVALMYRHGSTEAELAGLLHRHQDQLSLSMKFGLGSTLVPWLLSIVKSDCAEFFSSCQHYLLGLVN